MKFNLMNNQIRKINDTFIFKKVEPIAEFALCEKAVPHRCNRNEFKEDMMNEIPLGRQYPQEDLPLLLSSIFVAVRHQCFLFWELSLDSMMHCSYNFDL